MEVGANPTGGVVLPGDIDYAVAIQGENRIAFINTASLEVVGSLSEGIGESPFDMVISPNGRLGFVNNAGSADVSVIDLAERKVIERIQVGEQPIGMALRPDGTELWVSCEGSHRVAVIKLPAEWAANNPVPEVSEPTAVGVMGMIHGRHRTSERWGLDEIRDAIRRFEPDVVLTEIPPNRWDLAAAQWKADGAIAESRVARFPEYVDALFPLWDEMGFEIEPCAAWNREMSDLRSARIGAFNLDPTKTEEAAAYSEARAALADDQLPGPDDDPALIHSEVYDEYTRRTFEPYDRFQNDYIGPGGWTNINRAHMDLIDAALDRHAGKRVLITFGAGHKYWFLDSLAEREDVRLMDVTPYLPNPAEDVNELVRQEVAGLHQFFQDWSAGVLPDDDASYARFSDAMGEGFEIVGPQGQRSDLAVLVDGLRGAHGTAKDAPARIWTRAETSREVGEGLWIATYEEWHESRGSAPTGRLSTALLREDSSAPGGFKWLHVHETWLPDAGPESE